MSAGAMRRVLAAAALLAASLTLTACASFSLPETGSSTSTVQSRMGRPMQVQALPGGGERWLYSTLPMGREVYHVDFDSQGTMTSIRQILDFQHLSTTPRGWTRGQVLSFYGPPYEITEVASFQGKVWTYRFLDDINLRRLAHIHIDKDGHVAKVMFTDEPLSDDNRTR